MFFLSFLLPPLQEGLMDFYAGDSQWTSVKLRACKVLKISDTATSPPCFTMTSVKQLGTYITLVLWETDNIIDTQTSLNWERDRHALDCNYPMMKWFKGSQFTWDRAKARWELWCEGSPEHLCKLIEHHDLERNLGVYLRWSTLCWQITSGTQDAQNCRLKTSVYTV